MSPLASQVGHVAMKVPMPADWLDRAIGKIQLDTDGLPKQGRGVQFAL